MKRPEVIQGPLENLIRKKEERNRLELECHLSLQRLEDAVVLLTKMLRENPDHWRDLELFVSCQIQRYKKSIRDAREKHDERKRRGSGSGEGVKGKEEVWEGEGEGEQEEEGAGGGDRLNHANTCEGGSKRLIPSTPSPRPLMDARDLLEATCKTLPLVSKTPPLPRPPHTH